MKFEPRVFGFDTRLTWTGERVGELTLHGERSIRVACPREFGGPEGEWTPEHLFVASVEVCIMTTFLWLIQNESIRILAYESEARGEATTQNGEFQFARITVRPRVRCADRSSAKQALELLKRAHRECLISKSLPFVVELSPSVEIAE